MVTTAATVEWTVVDTEVEALQLEYNWIKEFDPRFNVRYRDDKSLSGARRDLATRSSRGCWSIAAHGERACAISGRTRTPGQSGRRWICCSGVPGAHLFGWSVQAARPDRPALPARLHRQMLSAVCRPGLRRRAPRDRRGLLRLPLRQDRPVSRASWSSEMHAAAERLDFERAARLRDDLGALKRAMEKQAVVLGDGTDADVVAFAEDELEAAVQVFHVRGGRVRGQRGWVVEKSADPVDTGAEQLVEQFLTQFYGEQADLAGRQTSRRTRCRARCWCPRCRRRTASWRSWLSGLRGSPGRAAGAAARRQAGADGDRAAQRRRGARATQAAGGPATSPPDPLRCRDPGGPRPGRRAAADRVCRHQPCAGHRRGRLAGGVRGRAAAQVGLPALRDPGSRRGGRAPTTSPPSPR